MNYLWYLLRYGAERPESNPLTFMELVNSASRTGAQAGYDPSNPYAGSYSVRTLIQQYPWLLDAFMIPGTRNRSFGFYNPNITEILNPLTAAPLPGGNYGF